LIAKRGGGLKAQSQHAFEKRVADIYEVNPNYNTEGSMISGSKIGTVDVISGFLPPILRKQVRKHNGKITIKPSTVEPNWMEHVLQAVGQDDGWNMFIDDVNKVANTKNGRSLNQGPKYKLNWAQNTVLMAQGTFIGEEYHFCPVGYKAHKKFGSNKFRMKDNGDGTTSCETLCGRCKSWKVLDKAPISNVWSYKLYENGKPILHKTPVISAYVYKDKNDRFQLRIPYLEGGKRLSVSYRPYYGKAKAARHVSHDRQLYFYKSNVPSNKFKKSDRIQVMKSGITYDAIKTSMVGYYNTLLDKKRERLSAVSSSFPGIFNSPGMMKQIEFRLGSLRIGFMSDLILDMLDSSYNQYGSPIQGSAVKPNKGWGTVKEFVLNGGLTGAWPSPGGATNIGTSTVTNYPADRQPLELSWADGGYTDNYGLAPLILQMQESNKFQTIISLLSMGDTEEFEKLFETRKCKIKLKCKQEALGESHYGPLYFKKHYTPMFAGAPPKPVRDECIDKPDETEDCPLVKAHKGIFTTIDNPYYGIKAGSKIRIIFLLYNPGGMGLLPTEESRQSYVDQANKLQHVLDKNNADVLKYFGINE